MTRDDVIRFYKVEDGLIRSPGKFEDCPVWAPYYWALGLDGLADDIDGKQWTFNVTDRDRELFPELGNALQVHLVEDDHGFVYAETNTPEEPTDASSHILGYRYQGEIHCPRCARDKFGDALENPVVSDVDGVPLVVVLPSDEHPEGLYCAECNEELSEPSWANRNLYKIKLSNSDDDPTQIVAVVEGEYADKWAEYHGSLDGGTWDRADGPRFVYDLLYWRRGLLEQLKGEGYVFDESEYCEPEESDLAIAKHATECAECSGDWHKAERHMQVLGMTPG